jgi:hypothetical protein
MLFISTIIPLSSFLLFTFLVIQIMQWAIIKIGWLFSIVSLHLINIIDHFKSLFMFKTENTDDGIELLHHHRHLPKCTFVTATNCLEDLANDFHRHHVAYYHLLGDVHQ